MKNLDEKIARWSSRPSQTERDKIANAERAVRDCISQSADLANRDIRIFIHGSYRNNVNVRADSDIDIGVLCLDTFHYNVAPDLNRQPTITPATFGYAEYRSHGIAAVRNKFGLLGYSAGSKAIDVKSNSYRVDADIALFFEYRYYCSDTEYYSGVCIPQDDGSLIINWPEQHYQNAVSKNRNTSMRYKSCVRAFKKLQMEVQSNYFFFDAVPGFFLESVLYNVPNYIYSTPADTQLLIDILDYIIGCTRSERAEWTEPSQRKMLFGPHQKWSHDESINTLTQIRDYIIQ